MTDYQPYCTNNNNNPENLGELGWITAAIGAVVTIVTLLVKKYGGKKTDAWSSWSTEAKREFVNRSLVIATDLYVTGQVISIDEAMAVMVQQVEKDESWTEWKTKNPEFEAMIIQAQVDADKQNTSMASILSPNILLWGLVLSVAGYGVYWFMHRNDNKQQLLTTQKLA